MYDLRIQVTLKRTGEKPKTRTFKGNSAKRLTEVLKEIVDNEDKLQSDPDRLKSWRDGHKFQKLKEIEEKEYYRCRQCQAEVNFPKNFNDFQRRLTLAFHHMRTCAEWMSSTVSKVMES